MTQLLEFWWYELSPYLYGVGGVYFTLSIKNGGMYFAFALVLLSIWILTMRVHYRAGLLPVGHGINWSNERSGARRRARNGRLSQKI